MLTSQQFVWAAGEGIHRIHFTFAGVIAGAADNRIAGVRGRARAGGFIKEAIDIQLFAVEEHFVMRAVKRDVPAVIEVLLQVNKDLFVFFVVVSPVWRGVVTTTRFDLRTVGIPARGTAPHWRVGVDLGEFVTNRQFGGIGQISVNHAVDELFVCAVAFDKAVFVFVARDQATTHVPFRRQRCRKIGNVTLLVPAAVAGGNITGKLFAIGVLTHHVDGGGRITWASQQAGGTAHHFDALIQRHVALRVAKVPA